MGKELKWGNGEGIIDCRTAEKFLNDELICLEYCRKGYSPTKCNVSLATMGGGGLANFIARGGRGEGGKG